MDAVEMEIARILSSSRIIWSGHAFPCPSGLYICDCMYHGEAVFFPGTRYVHNIGFVLEDVDHGRIVFSIIQHASGLELGQIQSGGSYCADTGLLLMLNGPVDSFGERARQIDEAIRVGLPQENVEVEDVRCHGPTRCGSEETFVIQAGWGSGGYEVFNSPTCHILDHSDQRWEIEKGLP